MPLTIGPIGTSPVAITPTIFVLTFLPPKNPQAPLDVKNQARVLMPQFGNGFPEVAPDGINVTLKNVTLNFDVLDQNDFTAINTFITTNLSVPFYYTLPDETTARLWIVKSRSRRRLGTTWSYDITLNERPIL